MWKVPPGFFPDPANDPSSPGNMIPAFQSAQAYLEASGITFPEGSFVRYEPKANKIVICNTPENLELTDTIVNGGIYCIFPNPVVDIVALDCPLPAPLGSANLPWPTQEDIRKLPANEVKVLSQTSVVVKSGIRLRSQKAFFVSGKEKDSKRADDPKPKTESRNSRPGEFGAVLEVEPVVGPDGLTIELNYSYQLRRPVSAGTCAELNLTGALLVQDNSFKVFHVSPLETEGRALVLIAGVRLLDFDGTKTPASWEAQATP